MHPAPTSQHPIRDDATLDSGLKQQDNEKGVKSPINDSDNDDTTNTEHLLCGKHCAQNAWSNFILVILLWDSIKLETDWGFRYSAHSHVARKR